MSSMSASRAGEAYLFLSVKSHDGYGDSYILVETVLS